MNRMGIESPVLLCALVFGLTGLSAPSRADLFVSTHTSVEELTDSGTFVKTFVPSSGGGLSGAAALHFGPDGNLYVATANAIKVYNGHTGSYIKDFTAASALDFVFDASGNMYAVDGVSVQKYDASGTLLKTYTDGVSTPEGIIFAPNGRLLVSNTYSGAYANTITSLDPSNGSFSTFATGLGEPVGMTIGPDGRYYVANYTFALSYGGTNPDTIQVVGAGGGSSTTWNQGGNLHGAEYLVFVGNRLFVTSYYNGTVQIFDTSSGASVGESAPFPNVLGIAYAAATAVPEPSELVLLATGLLGVVLGLGKRR